MEEVWKSIPKWEGLYEASSFGRIRSCIRIIKRIGKSNSTQVRPYGGSLLSPKVNRNGYLEVNLWSDNKGSTASVHRLVCASFYGLHPYNEVNHKDGNKLNNTKDNLEWMTRKENILDRDNRKNQSIKLAELII